MVNDLLSAITNAIWNEFHTTFGDSMLIAKENIDQGTEPPCFTCRCLEPQIDKKGTGFVHTIHTFEIDFFPSAGNAQLNDVAERLNLAFEIIETLGTTPIKLKCTNRKAVISDDVLVFTFEIETYMTQTYEKETEMKDITIKTPEVQ